ncbi:four helix bundle protein [Fodinibius halophilus]|uniref:Four helix bundle protein n=1 Tax=Fodinibius halophilus TaxID=1736908 RepID=A0A6M1TC58_9BACT|nr:four helix bundle protein [Fodinibius halophilus]NGP88524.1 four helix bundle protein [Fodinibius halophilus]
MNNFRNLDVWDKAVELATYVYQITENFPKTETYGLTSQMRRSAISISSNIAEGAGRGSKKEFSHFLNISMGSCYELETQLTISQNLQFLNGVDFEKISDKLIEIQKMIYSLRKSLNA